MYFEKKIYKSKSKFKINLNINIAKEILDLEAYEHTAKENIFINFKGKGCIKSSIVDSKNSNNNINIHKINFSLTSGSSKVKKEGKYSINDINVL